jgi:hypothetical protein
MNGRTQDMWQEEDAKDTFVEFDEGEEEEWLDEALVSLCTRRGPANHRRVLESPMERQQSEPLGFKRLAGYPSSRPQSAPLAPTWTQEPQADHDDYASSSDQAMTVSRRDAESEWLDSQTSPSSSPDLCKHPGAFDSDPHHSTSIQLRAPDSPKPERPRPPGRHRPRTG